MSGGFLNILLTLAVGGVFGLIFTLLGIPNGLRIGALFGSALLSIFFGVARMPPQTQFFVQAAAGTLIGCTMERSDLIRLPRVIKPTAITLGAFLVLNLTIGALIHAASPLDWVSALMCGVPGGVTDIPVIAADMGADTPKVALAQLSRYILGVGVFPPMILAFDNIVKNTEAKKAVSAGNLGAGGAAKREKSPVRSPAALVCTLATGFAGGFAGRLTGIPAGTFLFSAAAVSTLKLKFDFAYFSPRIKKAVLLISGCYIGSLISLEDVRGFRLMALPLAITLGGYILNCFISGTLLSRLCGFTRKEGMLTTTPAGASDIALNSADIGVENTDIIIIQIFRAVAAMAVFPQIINLLVLVLPG